VPVLLLLNSFWLYVTIMPITLGVVIALLVLCILLVISALVSGSEAAFFSLNPADMKKIEHRKDRRSKIILQLTDRPEQLLATILITNNFVNVAIIILATFASSSIFNFTDFPLLGFLFKVVVITSLLLFFGEIMPKILATNKPYAFCRVVAYPLFFFVQLFTPLSFLLTRSTATVTRRLITRRKISIDDLSEALEITSGHQPEEKKILKGIATFGHTDVNEIMKPRLDVVALDITTGFNKLKATVVESGYSRIPIFDQSFDDIKGVLYVKDLLPHIDRDDGFEWQTLIRLPYFVPESKKISGLLAEFQKNRIHMAIVVDEYGGTCGIVSLEDILEEIVGEISDESDDEVSLYTKIDDNNYFFEGKILLNDFCKVVNVDDTVFDDVRGEAETLAGLILEITGQIPSKNEVISNKNFRFVIDSVDNKRIKRVKVTIGG
jgi:putative hemolysin